MERVYAFLERKTERYLTRRKAEKQAARDKARTLKGEVLSADFLVGEPLEIATFPNHAFPSFMSLLLSRRM